MLRKRIRDKGRPTKNRQTVSTHFHLMHGITGGGIAWRFVPLKETIIEVVISMDPEDH
jgi:hypothetical protein